MDKCRFCGTKTATRVWTRGTRKLFVPICSSIGCWKRYWKSIEQ